MFGLAAGYASPLEPEFRVGREVPDVGVGLRADATPEG